MQNKQKKQQRKATNARRPRRTGGLASTRMGLGIPVRMQRVLPYNYLYTSINGVAGTPSAAQTFRLNSLFDPDYTNVGHQPLYYDQLLPALYQNYRVTHTNVTLEFLNTTTAATSVVGYISPSPTVAITNPNTLVELPNSFNFLLASVNAGGALRTRKFTVEIAKYFAIDRKKLLAEDDFASGYAANPVQTLFLHLFTTGLSAAGSVQVSVLLEYHSILYELSNPVGS